MVERARVRLIRASQSAELREVFRQLSELEGPDGPKFSRRILMELAARVVGRAYEPMLLELCHLARAALLADRHAWSVRTGSPDAAGFEWLFWGVEEARTRAFRAAFAHGAASVGFCYPAPPGRSSCGGEPDATASTLSVGDEAVVLRYTDGRFELRYARMASLAAMMEFLISTLGYRALAGALDPLSASVLDRGAVAAAARDLARRVYAWLGDHLPAAQAQRKFHTMIEFLEQTLGTEFTEDDIDDETVLRFWLAQLERGTAGSSGPNPDFRGYRNTFLAFLTLSRVLAAGAELARFERFVPIGSDIEAGEIDPAADASATEGVEEEDPLARLQEEPAVAVKALNRRELALLRLPVGESDGVRRLPRSYLRAECFGPVQNRLSQGLRRKVEPAELAAIAAAGPKSGYGAWIGTLETTDAHVRRVAKACLYVMHRMAGTGSDGEGDSAEDEVFELDFRILGEARKAFDGLNRAGFERSALNDPRLAPAYRALAQELPAVSERLGAVLRTLGAGAVWEPAEAEDRPVFASALARLYGEDASRASRNSGNGERTRDAAGGRNRTGTVAIASEGPARPAEGHP